MRRVLGSGRAGSDRARESGAPPGPGLVKNFGVEEAPPRSIGQKSPAGEGGEAMRPGRRAGLTGGGAGAAQGAGSV